MIDAIDTPIVKLEYLTAEERVKITCLVFSPNRITARKLKKSVNGIHLLSHHVQF
jgi:hypothetical protein